MSKKSVKIAELVQYTNQVLRDSTSSSAEREALCVFIENFLISAKAYKGYTYLSNREVPEGHKPGIILDGNEPIYHPEYCDNSRRFYFS